MSYNNLVKGMTVTIWTTDCREIVGVFCELIVVSQVLPAIVLETIDYRSKQTVYIPVTNITAIILPESSILAPTISEVKEALIK